LSGTWGDTVNNSITSLLDSAVAGTTTLSADADVTLTTTTGASNTSRQAILLWTAGGTVARNITAPAQSKIYTVINASSSTQSIVLRGAGPTTGVTIIKGESAVCAWNGSDFIKISNTSGAGAFTSITLTGTAATNTTALSAQGTTTGFNRGRIFNTGGDLRFGIDSSVGSEAVANSAAYSSFIGSFTSTPLYLVSNSAIAATIDTSGNLGIGRTPTAAGTYKMLELDGATGGYMRLYAAGTLSGYFYSNATESGIGSVTSAPFVFYTANTERMRLDSSGNLGIGVTPSAWSGYAALQTAGGSMWGSSNLGILSTNTYFSSGYKYATTNFAEMYQQSSGAHTWYTAPSGTAGNAITFTQAMTLDASGRLSLGTTTASTGFSSINLSGGPTGANTGIQLNYAGGAYGGGAITTVNAAGGGMSFFTFIGNVGSESYTERMRIDSSGNLLVGITSGATGLINAGPVANKTGIFGSASTAGNPGIQGAHTANSATGYVAYFSNSGSGTGLYISNTAAWQSTSDARLKTDVKDLNSTARLMALRPVDYLWKSQETSDEPTKRNFGFIAQEVKDVFPELVGVAPDGMYSVEYTGLIAPLVKAIQELKAEFDAYKASHP
jgi:hypothetical protein